MTHNKSQEAGTVTSWAEALKRGRSQLLAAKKRVHDLTLAIRVCEQKVRSGERFPVESHGVPSVSSEEGAL